MARKILKLPEKRIKKISPVRTIRKMAESQEGLVKNVEMKELTNENRSLFFRKEFIKEKKEALKFLS